MYGLRRNFRAASRRRWRRSRRRGGLPTGAAERTGYSSGRTPFVAAGTRVYRTPAPTGVTTMRRIVDSDYTWIINPLTSYADTQALGMKLNSLPGYSEFTGMFDQYRIVSITASLMFVGGNTSDVDNANPIGALNRTFPILYYCSDTDDTASITVPAMQQRGNCKICQLGDGSRTSLTLPVPCYTASEIVGLDATVRPAGIKRSPWLDCANPDILHGAVKVGCRGTVGIGYNFACAFDVVVQFRHTR